VSLFAFILLPNTIGNHVQIHPKFSAKGRQSSKISKNDFNHLVAGLIANFFKVEKTVSKKSKKKQVFVPVYLDLPEVHTTQSATCNRLFLFYFTILCALQFPLTSIFTTIFFSYFRLLTHTANRFQMTLVQPTGEMNAKIREELREPDEAAIVKDVAAIREWLEKQPHLPKDMGKFRLVASS
jgi:hypothetical protein